MYEMSTGKKPFTGKNSLMTLDAVLHREAGSAGKLNPKVPVELEGIIGKAMEKDRKDRYQSATQMKADLQQLKRENESGQVRVGSTPRSCGLRARRSGRKQPAGSSGCCWEPWRAG
jgi:serine/threonine protein kinase